MKKEELLKKYDLRSVRHIITGAAPLGIETAEDLSKIQPTWKILQAYGTIEFSLLFPLCWFNDLTKRNIGLTETTAIATHTSPHDILYGSSGSLIPLLEARLATTDGTEVTEHNKPGELLLKGPTVVPGYLNNEQANKETFRNGWLHTGDEAVIRKSPEGEEHIFVVDRIKELIKVKVPHQPSVIFQAIFLMEKLTKSSRAFK